eukprot:CAMPEP_0178416704 /NCGR_PEP_ID=MMETSP0689_2-20121128/24199_1 /TAXON_ID=160604 /ORGANISM="Amphidinium massartii, Strain CS-259" /LENGTH=508 /DNA_ID=CAMNT_0020038053 /DNA_START=24 /DNA_END=1547 /DNA_ORIENTATION=-
MITNLGGIGNYGSNDDFEPPLQKLYFNSENLFKCEPLTTALLAKNDGELEEDILNKEYNAQLQRYSAFEGNSQWDGKVYDMVFYGVSGYTGYLMMEYIKRTALKTTPEEFTFAFAGRTASKVQQAALERFRGTEYEDCAILQMSYDNIQSVVDLVKSAKVVINVAGPYMLTRGELLIDACCLLGRDYVDISGEIPWSLRALEFHNYAKERGSFVIPSAAAAGGFPDLCTYLCAQNIRERTGEELLTASCYTFGGGASASASGGTLKTRAAMSSSGDEVRKAMGDPFSLGGFIPDIDRHGFKSVNIEFGTGICRPKVRQMDIDANIARVNQDPKTGFWRGPFVYSYFDTRVVRRSNMLFADYANRPYGSKLNFMEYAILPDPATMQQAGGGGGGGGPRASVEDEKKALEAAGKYYKEGEGPPLEDLMSAYTGYLVYAESGSGVVAKSSMLGRDGYYETARAGIETALTLVFDRKELPFRGGVLTPTVAVGDAWKRRLVRSCMIVNDDKW